MINTDEMTRYLSVVKGLGKSTVYHVVNRLKYINKYLLFEITQDGFLDFIAAKKEVMSPSSINSLVIAWNHYVAYLSYANMPNPYKPIGTMRAKVSPARTFMTPVQMRSLAELKVVYSKNSEYLNQVYRALFMFYALTGARVSEAISLKVKDTDLATKSAWFMVTKNGDPRKVLLPDELVELMTPFCQKDPNRYVFCTSHGGQYDRQDINDELQRRAKLLGYTQRIHVHLFRHSFVSLLLQQGVDITTVARMIGHRNINTSFAIYGHLVDDMFRNALDKHPLVLDKLDPHSILKQDLDLMKKLRIFKDKRFETKVVESGDSIELVVTVKEEK